MPVVFYDSNAILDQTIDISTLTAPTEDDTGIQPTRNMWFDFSALATQTEDVSENIISKGKCFIDDITITIKKDRDEAGVDREMHVQHQIGHTTTKGAVVAISFVPNIHATDISDNGFSVTGTTSSTLYAKEGNVPIADNSYDVALGCYTWEQIYATPHALLTTQNATNGANAATFGTLIYDKDKLDEHRKVAYTTIFKKIYGDLFGLTAKTQDVPGLDGASNVYWELDANGREVHTFEMYVTLDDNGSSQDPVDAVNNIHQVEWYLDRGTSVKLATKVETDTTGMSDAEVVANTAGRFWRDMIIEHTDLSGNIDFMSKATPGRGDVFPYWQINETRTIESVPVFKSHDDGTATEYKHWMQRNFSSMLINVLNHYNGGEKTSAKRHWICVNGDISDNTAFANNKVSSMFGAVGGVSAIGDAVGHKLVGTRFQTQHHHKHTGGINLVFEQCAVTDGDFANIITSGTAGTAAVALTPKSFGELVEVNIPVKSSNYSNYGVDSSGDGLYELILRANLDLTFDVDGPGTAETGTVFYGQTTGTLRELMFGIYVNPEDPADVGDKVLAAIRANDAYKAALDAREIVRGYANDIDDFVRDVSESAAGLSSRFDVGFGGTKGVAFSWAADVSYNTNMAAITDSDATTDAVDLIAAHETALVGYMNLTAGHSADADAAISTDAADAAADLAETQSALAVAEKQAAINRMEYLDVSGSEQDQSIKKKMIDVIPTLYTGWIDMRTALFGTTTGGYEKLILDISGQIAEYTTYVGKIQPCIDLIVTAIDAANIDISGASRTNLEASRQALVDGKVIVNEVLDAWKTIRTGLEADKAKIPADDKFILEATSAVTTDADVAAAYLKINADLATAEILYSAYDALAPYVPLAEAQRKILVDGDSGEPDGSTAIKAISDAWDNAVDAHDDDEDDTKSGALAGSKITPFSF
jgi:hypothetical protein